MVDANGVSQLCASTVSLHIYSPPIQPDHVYSQAYWSAVIAAALYFILAVLLMINMLGYFLGRYPQHFTLTDDQRTLILQMTALVAWLLIGAAIFQRIMSISFADALYFCDITVLTLGFGDVTPQTATGKGLVWPYAVIGVIMLGLVVGSIHRFAKEVHYDNVVRKHIESKRQWTFERTVTFNEQDSGNNIMPPALIRQESQIAYHPHHKHRPIRSAINTLATGGKPKLLVMREEKDRFDAMRAIQYETMKFRRWNNLIISVIVFGIVWSCGAVIFWLLENNWSYFDALYFCFVCLLTIGYGDYTPQSNAGRPFFVVWSLVAIPTMTMLISQMSDTVVSGFKNGTSKFAEVFIMPEAGTYRGYVAHVPVLDSFIKKRQEKKRIAEGFRVGASPDIAENGGTVKKPGPTLSQSRRSSMQDHPRRTIEELAQEANPSPFELAQQLAFAIRTATEDVCSGKRKRYTYEEWVEFTRLIQFTNPRSSARNSSAGPSQSAGDDTVIALDEDEFGVLNWDWIGESSPMLAHQSEPEWVLDRLCESLIRYIATQERKQHRDDVEDEEKTLEKEKDLGIEES